MVNIKILLVEDENIEALDIKKTLESFGYEVPYIASYGEEAIKKAEEILDSKKAYEKMEAFVKATNSFGEKK